MALANNATGRNYFYLGLNGISSAEAGTEDQSSFSSPVVVNGSTGITQDIWFHFCATFLFSTPNMIVNLFINGAADGNVSSDDTENDYSLNRVSICHAISLTVFPENTAVDGTDIAESAIWNRILSTAEIAALGKGFSPIWFRNGLVLYQDLIRDLNRPGIGPVLSDNGPGGASVHASHAPKIIYPFRRRFTGIHNVLTSLKPSATRLAGEWRVGG